jgi:hypothetical protein
MWGCSCVALILFRSIQITGALLLHTDVQDNPHRIVMQMAHGCSGSTFIWAQMKQLTQKHGYDVWAPIKEFLEAYKVPKKSPYCTESDGTEHYWQGDPHYLANLHAAWNVLNGSIKCKERDLSRPTIFFFDGHKVDRMAGVVPFFERAGSIACKCLWYGAERIGTYYL